MAPKPKRIIDDKYREFVSRHPCCNCGYPPPSAPHHLITKGAGGGDYYCVHLCRLGCHVEIHNIGRETFQEIHDINLWKVTTELLIEWIKEIT